MSEPALHNPGLAYMRQLDAIRFIAVLLVFFQHLLGSTAMPWGHLGVSLFFVLSGFLITGILLKSREKVDALVLTKKTAIWQFYARRVLRIFPLYYGLTIVFAIILNVGDGRRYWAWLLAYGMNYQISLSHFEGPVWSGFWSLAVEEHFYLIWPAIILLAPRRLRLPATLLLIVIGPLWRAICLKYGFNDVALRKIDFACLDSLGLGALLAQVHLSHKWRELSVKALNWVLLPGAIFIFAAVVALEKLEINWTFEIVFSDLAAGIIFCWIINKASSGFRGITGRVLSSEPMVGGGRITYGLYCYHPLVLAGVGYLAVAAGLPKVTPGWVAFLIVAPLTIVAASLSWKYFEFPINKLKDRIGRRVDSPPLIKQDSALITSSTVAGP